MRFIRNTTRGLELRIQEYKDASGKTITTVGAMHSASVESWKKLITYLETAESKGAVIHLEGVKPAQDNVILSERQKNSILAMTNLIALGRNVSDITGLQYQKDAFSSHPNWVSRDVNILEMINGIDPEVMNKISKIPLSSVNISPKKAVWSLRNIEIIQFVGLFVPVVRKLLAALINDRNKFAIEDALSRDCDVVLFWGAAHLNGMNKLLLSAGFRKTASQWRLVIPTSHRPPELEKDSMMQSTSNYSNFAKN